MLHAKKLHKDAILPTVAHPGEDIGWDIYALEDVILRPFEVTKVRTGVAVAAYSSLATQPLGLLIRDRSSMASKGIIVSAGVVDAGYRGEIVVCMTLLNTKARYGFKDWEALEYSNLQPLSTGALAANPGYLIAAGDKIAQMIPIPVLTGEVKEVEEFDETARGSSGFGSTGR